MGEGTKKAFLILICGIVIGLLLGAAVLLFVDGNKIEKKMHQTPTPTPTPTKVTLEGGNYA